MSKKIREPFRFKPRYFIIALFLLFILIFIIDFIENKPIPHQPKSVQLTEIDTTSILDSLTAEPTIILFSDRESESSTQMEGRLMRLGQKDSSRKIFKLYIEDSPDLVSAYQISGTPTTLVFYDKKPIYRIMGTISEKNLEMINNRIN